MRKGPKTWRRQMKNDIIKAVALVSGLVAGMLVAGLVAVLFFSYPQGFYINATLYTKGAVAVYQDIKFGPDRIMYVGEPATAFRVYMRLTEGPPPPAPTMPQYRPPGMDGAMLR